MGTFVVLGIVGWIVCGLIAGSIAGSIYESRGGSFGTGFALGFFLGYLGLAYVAFVKPKGAPATVDDPSDYKTCPKCAEKVRSAAVVCRFCGHEFSPAAVAPPAEDGPTFEGRPVLDVRSHAFGVEWGRTDDGRIVLRTKEDPEWTLYVAEETALVPPRGYNPQVTR